MSKTTSMDNSQIERSSSTINSVGRSKKFAPPPLCLPATNSNSDEKRFTDIQQQRTQRKLSHNSCSSASSDDCSHKPVPFVLPCSQRPQILQTLISSSSSLLTSPIQEPKNKKPANGISNQANLLRERQILGKATVNDAEWIDFIRLIIQKPFADELKLLLDKYKTKYFDQVNAPNTSEETIRSSLSTLATELLNTYSTNNSSPISTTTTKEETNSLPIANPVNQNSNKRKRKTTSATTSGSSSNVISTQTKFVISYLIPGRNENGNTSKMTTHQKQFLRKYNHLFRYIPDPDEQNYLIRKNYVRKSSTSENPNFCLLLHDEVLNNYDDNDLQLSEISIDNSFLLPQSMVEHINASLS